MSGTNYYAIVRVGLDFERLHIGKSRIGWRFLLRIYPDKGINELSDWEPLFKQHRIEDEYGGAVSAREMYDWIAMRPPESRSSVHFVPGAKPGAGWWDLKEGEFS